MKSEIRKDYIQNKYVLIAPKRAKRPHDLRGDRCVFCPENLRHEEYIQTIGPKNNWTMAVVENKFSAVTLNNKKAYGVQEVIVETPLHDTPLERLPSQNFTTLLDLYAQRTKAISSKPSIQYIIIFKNQGAQAGASVAHAHSQIFATDFIPPRLIDKSKQVFTYHLRNGSCVYCDTIIKERLSPRFIWEDKNVIAFTPYASRYNYEVWILPKRCLDNITQLNNEEQKSWAHVMRNLLLAIEKLGLPYNYYFHQAINDTNQHLYMKITPRKSIFAGVEIGSGIVINPISPEVAAKYYRKTIDS